MARDNRIDYANRDPKPAQDKQEMTTSARVEFLVSCVLSDVSARLEEKHAKDGTARKR